MADYFQYFETERDAFSAIENRSDKLRTTRIEGGYSCFQGDDKYLAFFPYMGNSSYEQMKKFREDISFGRTDSLEEVLFESPEKPYKGLLWGLSRFATYNGSQRVWRTYEVLPFGGKLINNNNLQLDCEVDFWSMLEGKKTWKKIYLEKFKRLFLFDLEGKISQYYYLSRLSHKWSFRAHSYLFAFTKGENFDESKICESFSFEERQNMRISLDKLEEQGDI